MKFRRQQPVLFYIADFYCHELKLVIEVDGPIHKRKDRIIWDQNRRSVFEKFGIKILRFTNFEIKNHIGKVMDTIRNEILTQKRQELSTSNPQKNEK
jgi:very-short-patch-repair endonuclease